MTKQEVQIKLNKQIRLDTYWLMELIYNHNMTYDQAKKEILSNEKYNIDKKLEKQGLITKEKTIMKYIEECYEKEELDNRYGIYGIYIEDSLVYIGKTEVSFRQRFNQYKTEMKNPQRKIAFELNKAKMLNKKIELKPLITNIDFDLNKKEIEKIEYSLIKVLQPVYNVEGVILEYNYHKKN